MMTSPNHGMRRRRADQSNSSPVVNALIAECTERSKLMELYYWSQEPGLLSIIRSFAAMPQTTRTTVEAFLMIANDPSSIEAIVANDDELCLIAKRPPDVAASIGMR